MFNRVTVYRAYGLNRYILKQEGCQFGGFCISKKFLAGGVDGVEIKRNILDVKEKKICCFNGWGENPVFLDGRGEFQLRKGNKGRVKGIRLKAQGYGKS
jgi:hypothetical protein